VVLALLARGVPTFPCVSIPVVSVTYDEWFGKVCVQHSVVRDGQRLGQRYYNMLPREIADVIVATRLDPFAYEYITAELHDLVSKIWGSR